MKKPTNISLPLSFSLDDEFQHEKFAKLNLKFAHVGTNRNQSFIGMPAYDEAKNSLVNSPLLAFIKHEPGSDAKDFHDHGLVIELTDDDVIIKYLTKAIGVVPESADYFVSTDDEGINWINTSALIWKEYNAEALEILQANDGMKSVSMEISILDGEWDEGGVFLINKFRYNGICLLGNNIQPGMKNALGKLADFSAEGAKSSFSEQINHILTELNKEFKDQEVEKEEENEVDSVEESTEADVVTNEQNDEETYSETDESDNEGGAETTEETDTSNEVEDFEEVEAEVKATVQCPCEKCGEYEAELNNTKAKIEEFIAVTSAKQSEIESLKAKLKEYSNKEQEEQFNTLKEEFADELSTEDGVELLQRLDKQEFNYELFETHFYALRGKLLKKEPKKMVQFSFEKSNKNSKPAPIWSDLLKK